MPSRARWLLLAPWAGCADVEPLPDGRIQPVWEIDGLASLAAVNEQACPAEGCCAPTVRLADTAPEIRRLLSRVLDDPELPSAPDARDMLVAAFLPRCGDTATRVTLSGVHGEQGVLTVSVAVTREERGGDMLVRPYALALLDRFETVDVVLHEAASDGR